MCFPTLRENRHENEKKNRISSAFVSSMTIHGKDENTKQFTTETFLHTKRSNQSIEIAPDVMCV